jgi:hypothetical protein
MYLRPGKKTMAGTDLTKFYRKQLHLAGQCAGAFEPVAKPPNYEG